MGGGVASSHSLLGLLGPSWLPVEDEGIRSPDPGWEIHGGLGMEPREERDLSGLQCHRARVANPQVPVGVVLLLGASPHPQQHPSPMPDLKGPVLLISRIIWPMEGPLNRAGEEEGWPQEGCR